MKVKVEVEDDDLIPLEDGDAAKAAEAEVFDSQQKIIKPMANIFLAGAEESGEKAKEDKRSDKQGSTAAVRTPLRTSRQTVKFTQPGKLVLE